MYLYFIYKTNRYFQTKSKINLKTKLLGFNGHVKGSNTTAGSKDTDQSVYVHFFFFFLFCLFRLPKQCGTICLRNNILGPRIKLIKYF